MNELMSNSTPVQDLLEAFHGLTEQDQRVFVLEILRRTGDLEWPPLEEETINRIADESFQQYDIREAESRLKSKMPCGHDSASNEIHHNE